jgi:hypothetical protein
MTINIYTYKQELAIVKRFMVYAVASGEDSIRQILYGKITVNGDWHDRHYKQIFYFMPIYSTSATAQDL